VTVQQAAPKVIIQQPQVRVTQPPPQIVIRQAAPTITIQQPPPEIIVRMPELDVAVDVEQPEVTLQESQPAVQMAEQAQPQVTYEEVGEAKVVFEQAEPQITFQQLQTAETGTAVGAEDAAVASVGEMAATEQSEAGASSGQPANQEITSATEQSNQGVGNSEPAEVAASDIIGRTVVNEAGHPVGEVQSVAQLQDGGFAAVVMADAFLGIGERQYAIPFENLALATDALVVINLDDEALAQAPEWDQSFATRELAGQDTAQIRVWLGADAQQSQQ
jgi:sporulation protein YlmC with PRC-barrel domain